MLHCKLRVLQRFTPYSIGMHESFATPFVPGVMVRLVLPICRRWLKLAPLGWPLHYSDFFNLPTSNNMHSWNDLCPGQFFLCFVYSTRPHTKTLCFEDILWIPTGWFHTLRSSANAVAISIFYTRMTSIPQLLLGLLTPHHLLHSENPDVDDAQEALSEELRSTYPDLRNNETNQENEDADDDDDYIAEDYAGLNPSDFLFHVDVDSPSQKQSHKFRGLLQLFVRLILLLD